MSSYDSIKIKNCTGVEDGVYQTKDLRNNLLTYSLLDNRFYMPRFSRELELEESFYPYTGYLTFYIGEHGEDAAGNRTWNLKTYEAFINHGEVENIEEI